MVPALVLILPRYEFRYAPTASTVLKRRKALRIYFFGNPYGPLFSNTVKFGKASTSRTNWSGFTQGALN